jgi:hypothetical protein
VPLQLDYIGFQETKKQQFSNSYLKCVLGNRNFAWNHLPAVGSAGGILVGLNLDLFDIISWDVRSFSVSVIVRNKINDITVRITTVYGSPYEEKRMTLFLNFMNSSFIGRVLPLLVVISTLLDPSRIKVMVSLIIGGQINLMPG